MYKGNTFDVNFGECFGAIDLINKIKYGDVSLRKAVNDQYELKSKIGELKTGNLFGFPIFNSPIFDLSSY